VLLSPIEKFEDDINYEWLISQMPGYYLWKDINSRYLMGNKNTAQLFGFSNEEELIGITDREIRCKAAEYADLFIKQDKKVLEDQIPYAVLDIHPYVDDQIKTLLINKSLLISHDKKIIGISCHCIEVNNLILNEITKYLGKLDPVTASGRWVSKKAANYYLNSQYPNLHLTNRQSECLFHLIRGRSAKEIARVLKLSVRTVESHIEDIKNKMDCCHKSEIVEKAIEKGFVEIIPAGIISNRIIELLKF